jgi:pyridoxine 4-dehydrogenase
VLHPYDGMPGLTRSGASRWALNGRPDCLRQQAHDSRKRLGVSQIGLWQLHRLDPNTPRDPQFETVRSLIDEGVIRYAGLSEVSVADIEAASRYFPVATVQNRFNLLDRKHEAVLDDCEKEGIGFIPFFPLSAGDLAKPGTPLDAVASTHGATPSQIAVAWMLRRSPAMLPIPGTSKVAHLKENVAAAAIVLTDDEFAELNRAGRSVNA